jgi:hypothetical protein
MREITWHRVPCEEKMFEVIDDRLAITTDGSSYNISAGPEVFAEITVHDTQSLVPTGVTVESLLAVVIDMLGDDKDRTKARSYAQAALSSLQNPIYHRIVKENRARCNEDIDR